MYKYLIHVLTFLLSNTVEQHVINVIQYYIVSSYWVHKSRHTASEQKSITHVSVKKIIVVAKRVVQAEDHLDRTTRTF